MPDTVERVEPTPAAGPRAGLDTPVAELLGVLDSSESALVDLFWRSDHDVMKVVSPDLTVLAVNPTGVSAWPGTGSPVGVRLSVRALTVSGPDGEPLPQDRWPLFRALAGERVERQQMRVAAGDGVRLVVCSALPVRLRSGATGALLIWHDVTASWHPSAAAEDELNRLRTLVEGATDFAMVLLDLHGRVRSWSAAAEKLYGRPTDGVLGRHYATFFEDEDRERGLPEQILTQAVVAGRAVAEGKRVRGDGSRFWTHCVVTSIRAGDGAATGFVLVAHDVSERLATENAVVQLNEQLRDLNLQLEGRVQDRTRQLQQHAAELAAANAELEAFSYSVSHDLRAPLRSMVGFAALLEEEFTDLPSEGLHFVRRIRQGAAQMGSLIDALLAFSRLQRQTMIAVTVDMDELFRSCWHDLAEQRAGRVVDFVLSPLPAAHGDPRLLQRVVANLLDNALKYTSAQDAARIEVSGRREADGLVRYQVSDDGAGFDPRFAAKLGQVFQRLHRADEFPGNGVGLALAQRIVARHGGTISAEGATGAGATFGFTLREA